MKSPMFTRAGFHGTAIVAGLLVVTALAGCATVSTVTSSVPSVPPSTFGHANSVGIDESSAAVNRATHERLLAVANPIGFSLRAFALGTSIEMESACTPPGIPTRPFFRMPCSWPQISAASFPARSSMWRRDFW
jgi:uncharacterized protein YceK